MEQLTYSPVRTGIRQYLTWNPSYDVRLLTHMSTLIDTIRDEHGITLLAAEQAGGCNALPVAPLERPILIRTMPAGVKPQRMYTAEAIAADAAA